MVWLKEVELLGVKTDYRFVDTLDLAVKYIIDHDGITHLTYEKIFKHIKRNLKQTKMDYKEAKSMGWIIREYPKGVLWDG